MRSVLLLALALALGATPLAAQVPGSPPTAPDSTLTPAPRDSGFAEWRRAVAVHGRAGVSFLVEGARYQVLVLTPMAIDGIAPDSLILKHTRGCMAALELPFEEVEASGAIRPWVAFDSAAFARPVVAFTVLPAEPRRFDCRAGNLARFSATSRGALYGRLGAYDARRDVARAEVRRGGVLEPAVLAGRAPVTKFDVGRRAQDGTQHLRLYIEAEALAPDADGTVPVIEIHAWNGVDDEPEILPMPEQVLRAVWQQLLPWRARMLRAAGAPIRDESRLWFATPTDSVLREAQAAYARGDLAPAGAAALDRLLRLPRPPRREIRDAMLMSAAVFSAYGEDAGAHSLVADVMEVFPCLTLAPEAPQRLRDFVEVERRPARCTTIPLPLIAARSIVPGWGQATGPTRTKLAWYIFGGTAGALGLSSVLHAKADRDYEDYRAYRGNSQPPAAALYERAQLSRSRGNILAIIAVGTWALSAVEAVLEEQAHGTRLREVHEVGRAPAARRVSTAVTPLGIGLSVSFR